MANTKVETPQAENFDCLVVGVGGQGVVLASRLIAAACMNEGAFVRTAETIGMSQRGGSVASHVRTGSCAEDVPSSLIPAHEADLVLAFEPAEAVRAYSQLKAGGRMVVAMQPVVPVMAANSGYDGEAQADWLKEHIAPENLAFVDPAVLVASGLSAKCLNVMLLGAAIKLGALPFTKEQLQQAMQKLMKPKLIEMNEKALELGIN
ncbi:MAG: 2-oxoacid:acceptor oxidoreductase family protein [Coriobacteriales bacterium]|nr:2-oxoacid:acceptor oxidoreductase family protein [Coriobacteriales bacterium]